MGCQGQNPWDPKGLDPWDPMEGTRGPVGSQRGPLGPELAIWPRLTASEHEICHIDIMHDTLV